MSEPRTLGPEEAVDRALLYAFQLSKIDYEKVKSALAPIAFLRALQFDGYVITRDPDAALAELRRKVEAEPFSPNGTLPDHAGPMLAPTLRDYRRRILALLPNPVTENPQRRLDCGCVVDNNQLLISCDEHPSY